MRWFCIFSIALLLIVVTGVESCSMPGGGGQTSKGGLDFSLIQGVGFFKQGMEIEQGDTFKVGLKIENFDKEEKTGRVCVKDDKDSAYGGMYEDCSQFYVGSAEYDSDKFIKSRATEVYFPTDMEYSYHDIPIAQPGKITVTVSYVQHSIIQGSVSVPEPAEETSMALIQQSAPISVTVEKTISTQSSQYKVGLKVSFTQKSDSTLKIFNEDLSKENNINFRIKLEPSYTLDCQQGIINIESTKFIKCSTLLPLEQVTNPLLIYLDYGVKITKPFDFKITKEAKK